MFVSIKKRSNIEFKILKVKNSFFSPKLHIYNIQNLMAVIITIKKKKKKTKERPSARMTAQSSRFTPLKRARVSSHSSLQLDKSFRHAPSGTKSFVCKFFSRYTLLKGNYIFILEHFLDCNMWIISYFLFMFLLFFYLLSA